MALGELALGAIGWELAEEDELGEAVALAACLPAALAGCEAARAGTTNDVPQPGQATVLPARWSWALNLRPHLQEA